VNRKSPNFKI